MRWLTTPLLVSLAAVGATGSLEVRTEPGAEVLWEGTSIGSTDGSGRLRVQDVPAGTYRLVVKGSHSQVSTSVEVGSGATIVQLPLPSRTPTPARERADVGAGSRGTTSAPPAASRAPEPAPAEVAPSLTAPTPAPPAVAGAAPAASQPPSSEPAAEPEVAAPSGPGPRGLGSEPPAEALRAIEEVAPAAGSILLPVLAAGGLAALAAALAWRARARRSRRRRHRGRRREVEVEKIEVGRVEGGGSASSLVEQLRARERRLEDLVKARQGRRVVDVRDFEDRGDQGAG